MLSASVVPSSGASPNSQAPDVFRDGLEPAVLDPLAVVAAHRGVGVAHDQVDGNGVAGRVGDGAEDVPQGVEAEPVAVDAEPLQQAS